MKTSTAPPSDASEVAISSLLAKREVPDLEPAADYQLIQLAPQEGVDVFLWRGGLPPPPPPNGRADGGRGVDVFLWRGHFPQPVTMSVRDDWDRVHFTCSLRGRSGFAIRGCGREI